MTTYIVLGNVYSETEWNINMKADSTRTYNMKADSMIIDNKELNNGEATKEQTGQSPDTWQAYTKKTHVIGRTVSIITLVMLV